MSFRTQRAGARLLLAALFLLSAAASARAGVLRVDASLASGANDGSSWADAFQGSNGLQSALAVAVAGDQIWVAQGTYKPTPTTSRTLSFNLKTGVEVYGGFAGGETSLDQRDFVANPTILSGDLAGDDGANAFGENSHHVVRGNAATASAVLDGFTVRGGNANVSGSNNDRGGGFLMVGGSNATIRNCVVRENRCTFGGGAGYISGSGPSWTDVSFEDNVGGNFGGAFDMASANGVSFLRCRFDGNSAARAGGLEIFSSTNISVTDCLFTGNAALTSSGGGGIWVSGSNPTIRGCTIYANTSVAPGAGGIQGTAGTNVANTIVWGNQPATPQISSGAVSYCCVQGGFAGTGNVSSDPNFNDAPNGDFTLLSSSPCVDAGSSGLVPAASTIDLAGNPRKADDPGVADTGVGPVPVVDIGAFERQNELYTAFCFGDGSLATPCPCANFGSPGHGCLNSDFFSTGAVLLATGVANPDSVVLSATEMLPTVSCVFLQGNAEVSGGIAFGDGVRCVGGSLKRLAVKTASGGGASFPEPGDPSITARSAALGDPIAPGEVRYYQVYYRDPDLAFCPTGSSFNVTSGLALQW